MVKHSQSSQNNMFAMSWQYLEKEVRYEVDFLNVDKHKISYKLIWKLWVIKQSQNVQSNKLAIALQYLKN